MELRPQMKWLAAAVALGVVMSSHAAMYKWTDKNGKVHFSDKPPPEAQVKPDTVKTIKQRKSRITPRSAKEIPKVVQQQPLAATGDTRAVKLERIILAPGDRANTDAGVIYSGASCSRKMSRISRSTKRISLRGSEFKRIFAEELDSNGYAVSDDNEQIFSGQKVVDAELQLAALIKDIALDGCKRTNRSKKMRMSAWMSIEWKLFDALAREVIYEGATEGQADDSYDANVSTALNHVRTDAFRSALQNLLSDQAFVDRLHGKGGNTAVASAAPSKAPAGPLNLELEYGTGAGSFVKDVEALKRATVTIRSTTGHGTGFVVDQQGYVLTNAHVVGNASTVVIKVGETEHQGAVLRRDRKRDVALVQLVDLTNAATLKLAQGRTSTGAPIYVMGTPLDEAFNHTVTRGIISAVRKLKDGQLYYQTDAGVNPGNSGGPAFNDQGEVVGMAVSGIFTRQGGTTNINFLIPIDEVLGTLQIF